MNQESNQARDQNLEMVAEVDTLSEEIKTLALNLALYLARAKSRIHSDEMNRLEPEFIRLVNGTVRMVQEITRVIHAARNEERMIYQVPSGKQSKDQIEVKLHALLEQCTRILASLGQVKDIIA